MPHGILLDSARTEQAIGDAVVGSDCQDELASILCTAYYQSLLTTAPPPEYVTEMFGRLGSLLRAVEVHAQ